MGLRFALALTSLAAVILTACSDNHTSAPTATPPDGSLASAELSPIATPTSLPGRAGPVLVYSYLRQERPGEQSILTVATFDPVTRTTEMFTIPHPPGDRTVLVAKQRIIVNEGLGVALYNPDGSGRRALWQARDEGRVGAIAVSHDAAILALVSCRSECLPSANDQFIVFVDIGAGTILAEVAWPSSAFDGFTGVPNQITWRDDRSGVIVKGGLDSRPGALVTIAVTGELNVLGRHHTFVAGNGRYEAVVTEARSPCNTLTAHGVVIQELDSPRPVALARDADYSLIPYAWSPDSQEFLIAAWSPGWQGPDPCEQFQRDPPEWWLLGVGGDPAQRVGSIDDVLDRWYAGRRVDFICEGKRDPGILGHAGLLYSPTCYSSLEVRLNGTTVVTIPVAGRPADATIAGFMEKP